MRCNSCGWDNDPSMRTCVKCGQPIQGGMAGGDGNYSSSAYQDVNVPNYSGAHSDHAPRPTVVGIDMQERAPRPTVVSPVNMGEHAPRRTVVSGGGMGYDTMPLPQPGSQGSRPCPQCGYLVLDDFTSCPSCGAAIGNPSQAYTPKPAQTKPVQPKAVEDLLGDETVKCDHCGNEVSIKYSFCPKCGKRIHLKTMPSRRHKPTPPPTPVCQLTIIPEEEEQLEPTPKDYSGESVILNRENTEPDNRTITSKEQAELTYKDGKWFLMNHSELHSTYIEVNRPMELQAGDTIVLGDRRFRFEPK